METGVPTINDRPAGDQPETRKAKFIKNIADDARRYLKLPLRQWFACNVYLLVLSSWKVNIAENPIALMGL